MAREIDEILMADVRDNLKDQLEPDAIDDVILSMKESGFFDIDPEFVEFPDDELGTSPLW